MRVTLLHNPEAGEGEHGREALLALLREARHEARYHATDEPLERVLAEPADLVAVVGGDGTVTKVAVALAGRDVPLTVLPFGTANNVATSLGLVGPPGRLVAGWARGTRRRLDVGTVRGAWGTERFVEGAGVGAIAELLAETERHDRHETGDDDAPSTERVRRGVRALRDAVAGTRAVRMRVRLDGAELGGEWVIAAALNIPRIGPSVPLAPHADVGDGLLDVVLVGEPERAALLEWLDRRIASEGADVPTLPVRRARHVVIRSAAPHAQVDDALRTPPQGTAEHELEVVLDSAVEVLLPG